MGEIDIVAAETALGEDERNVGRKRRFARRRSVDHHACEPRRQRQLAKAAAFLGDVARAVDRPEFREQSFRLGEGCLRRRIEERERGRVGNAPMGEIEYETRKVGGENFGLVRGRERGGLGLIPESVADAWFGASGAAAALVGRGARDAHRFEPREAHVGLVARYARKPAVDHDAHALNRERSLGDRGRQHDLAPAARRGRDRAVLHLRFERAIERDDVDRRVRVALAQQRLGAADFAGAGKESEHRTCVRAQRPLDGVRDARSTRTRVLRPRYRVSTGKARPPPAITGASPRSFATRAASMVADITRSFRSSRKPCCTSRASASPRSASSDRSWNSSNRSAATPSRDASSSTMRVNTPSVTTSMRVRRDTFEPKRTR